MIEPFGDYTGRDVKVAIIDSGVNPVHPHVEGIAGGVRIGANGFESSNDYYDFNGHGTAVAGAIREKAPDALLYPVKVFERDLTTTIEVIINAIEWAIEQEVAIINLSLGTSNEAHREKFERVVELAARKNILIVSARRESDKLLLPGCLSPVIGVEADPECPREIYRAGDAGGHAVFSASVFPRDAPGVPRERNFNGISFAVANMTGFVARAREMRPRASVMSVMRMLIEALNCE